MTVYDFLLVDDCNYSSIVYYFFSYLTLSNVVTLKYGREVTQGYRNYSTIRKLGCGFLFAFYSNYSAVFYRLRDMTSY